MAQNKNKFGLGSYNPASGFLIQNKRVGYDEPILSGGASTMTGSSMPDSLLNKIRQAAGMQRVDRKVGVPTQETDSSLVQKIREGGIGDLFKTDPVLAARMAAAAAPVSPYQESDEAFDLAPLELDIFSPDSSGGIGSALSALTGKTDMPGMGTFGGTIPEGSGTTAKSDSGEITSVADDLAAMAGAEAREADERSPMTLMAEAEAQEGDEASKEAIRRVTNRSKDPFEAALAEAMKSYEDAKAGEDTGSKDIDYYKKQFADATGIDVSGKVDKSQALMAFGLALMQNKAGKGFDVGKILDSVGKAGEAAMPALEKAQDRAAAGKLAAGKFALQQLDSDEKRRYESLIRQEDRIAELKKASASAASDRALEIQKHANDMEKARLETRAEVEAASIKAGADLNKLQFDFSGEKAVEPLTSKPNIKMHIANRKSDGREVFTKPSTDVDLIAKGYADALDGTASIDNMIDLVTAASNEFQGGLSGAQLVTFLDNKLSAFGIEMNVEYGTGRKLSPVTELRAVKDRLIAQYKRFLTQETGNGISNTDVERLAASLGEVDFFTNPQEAIKRLQETRLIFTSSEDALKSALLSYTDKSKYLDPRAYDEVQAQINKSAFGAAGLGKGAIPTFKNKDGVTVIKLS